MNVNEYLDLKPSENYQKPLYMRFVEAVLQNVILLSVVNDSIYTAFDIDNAAGNQLDIIGELVGLNRLLSYVPVNGTRQMDDDEYRLALKLKIARNEWDGKNGSIEGIYEDIFREDVHVYYKDEQDCSVTYSIVGSLTTREAEILNATNVLLVPAGVGKTIEVVSDEVHSDVWVGTFIYGIESINYVEMV